MIFDYALVLVLAVLAGGWAIPSGITFDLSPAGVWLAASVGSCIGLAITLYIGGRGWDALDRRLGSDRTRGRSERRATVLLRRWGVPGLALIGNVVLGPTVTTLTALAAGVDRRRFVVWSIVATFGMYAALTAVWAAAL